MTYMSITCENESYWMELDEERYAWRQVIIDRDSRLHASCREDCLAEGAVTDSEEDLEGECRDIPQAAFEEIWSMAVKDYHSEWMQTKEKYPVGSIVQGICQHFYPHGTIVKGDDFDAVYQGWEDAILRKSLTAQVAGYDETNMWLVLCVL